MRLIEALKSANKRAIIYTSVVKIIVTVKMSLLHGSMYVFFRTDYPCEMIPLLNVVLFKTADTCIDLREKAAQLLQILER